MPRGGIGLGIADNSRMLFVQYLVDGGPAKESNFFDIGDEIIAVDRFADHWIRSICSIDAITFDVVALQM
jgi:C-terminal processing protease CtpA/Prc